MASTRVWVGLALAVSVNAQRTLPANAVTARENPGIAMSSSRQIPPIVDGQFVRRQGALLTLNGLPFRFHGNNVYYNQADVAYGRIATVEETYDKMASLGLTVVRANAHNDHPAALDPAAIQSAPGVHNETNLVALDRSIALAKSRNLRLILKFTNNWDAYGGIRRYVAWHLGRTPTQSESALFYTEPRIKDWYRNYVRTVIDRRNTITGLTYRNEPAILAWELGNELRNPGNANALLAWTAEMAAFIKQLDANHLIADGGEGFDDDPSLYPGLSNRYTVSGSDGCSFHRLAQIPELDLLSYHLYPTNWRMNDTADAALYIRRHEEIARQHGKVAYLGEYGKTGPDPARAAIFQRWLQTATNDHASSGVMLWHLINDAKTDSENYQLYCPQHADSCAAIRQSAEALAAAPVVTNAASYQPLTLAPASIATLFGANLANTQLTLTDAANRAHPITQSFFNDTQINFQIPEAAQPGSAILRVVRNGETQSSAAMQLAKTAPGIFGNGPQEASPAGILTLYATGLRAHEEITATLNSQPVEILYAGPQNQYPGLDQINLRLPEALPANPILQITVDGVPANPVPLTVR
jgi:mannan endo-1,4-beta-mannosidase